MKTFIYLTKLNKEEMYCMSGLGKKEAEDKLRMEIENKLRREMEDKLREIEENLRREIEEKVRREVEQKAREEARRQNETEEKACKEAEGNHQFKNLSIGNIIKFGRYKQDSNPANREVEIEWIVLDKKDNRYLVTSKYALDCRPYNRAHTAVTWETCTLRTWLNETFMESAFDADEKTKIVTTTVTADKNPRYGTNPGKDTKDRVFLLSIKEAKKYFSNDADRRCAPTDYAKAQGARAFDKYSVGGKATCWWWLRSPGDDINCRTNAAYVRNDGSVNDSGDYVYYGECVRPALWIDPES